MAAGTIPTQVALVGQKLPDVLPACGPNAGGLLGVVRFYPVGNVLSVPPVFAGQHVGVLGVLDPENYLDVFFGVGGGQFVESEEDSDQGSYYKSKLTLTVGKDDPDLGAALAVLRQLRYYVAVYLDGNGLTKLVGSPETPLRFLSALETGRRGTDLNGHQLTFSAETVDPAGFYQTLVVPPGGVRRVFSSGFTFGFQRV